jgi:hypothetical protein
VSGSTDEHLAASIAAIRDSAHQWIALVDAERVAARRANRRVCLLASLVCGLLLIGAATACAMTIGLAFRGTPILVPIVVALFGMSGALPFYALAAAAALMAVRADGERLRHIRVTIAVIRAGQAMFIGSALAVIGAGVLVAVNGFPAAAILGVGAGATVGGFAVAGRALTGLVQRTAAA